MNRLRCGLLLAVAAVCTGAAEQKKEAVPLPKPAEAKQSAREAQTRPIRPEEAGVGQGQGKGASITWEEGRRGQAAQGRGEAHHIAQAGTEGKARGCRQDHNRRKPRR